jgi:16S rRNA (guanine966-N2)-methyltransferase
MVRESIFSVLWSQLGDFGGKTLLDGYCGSGILGLEFLSRGAAFVDFVEKSGANLQSFRKNILAFETEIEHRYRYWHGSMSWFLDQADPQKNWDVVWFDPPFSTFPEIEIHSVLSQRKPFLFGIHVSKFRFHPYRNLLQRYTPGYHEVYAKTFGESSILVLRKQ